MGLKPPISQSRNQASVCMLKSTALLEERCLVNLLEQWLSSRSLFGATVCFWSAMK